MDYLPDNGGIETSANFYQATRRNIPEDSHFHEWFNLARTVLEYCER
jgi:hypothetical protein